MKHSVTFSSALKSSCWNTVFNANLPKPNRSLPWRLGRSFSSARPVFLPTTSLPGWWKLIIVFALETNRWMKLSWCWSTDRLSNLPRGSMLEDKRNNQGCFSSEPLTWRVDPPRPCVSVVKNELNN